MPNALAGEKSPCLLEHAENPVAWLPWGEAAFARARAEQKPIFLSIGDSTEGRIAVAAEDADVGGLGRKNGRRPTEGSGQKITMSPRRAQHGCEARAGALVRVQTVRSAHGVRYFFPVAGFCERITAVPRLLPTRKSGRPSPLTSAVTICVPTPVVSSRRRGS